MKMLPSFFWKDAKEKRMLMNFFYFIFVGSGRVVADIKH
jgi:hypothetical protein